MIHASLFSMEPMITSVSQLKFLSGSVVTHKQEPSARKCLLRAPRFRRRHPLLVSSSWGCSSPPSSHQRQEFPPDRLPGPSGSILHSTSPLRDAYSTFYGRA